jgi:coenzyme F420-dependent glucose-6-phosphate dehydrogenase
MASNTTDALGSGCELELGYWLSSEEHDAPALIRNAACAEQSGFRTAMISDHLVPWLARQGHSPFVWSVLGGIACETSSLRVGVGVTAPVHRYHPVTIAQAAATVETMMPGRFFVGLGTGERLNEHVVSPFWPPPKERRAALREAADVVRRLLAGERVSHDGRAFTVDRARLFTRPHTPPPIVIAASGKKTARLAAEHADGMLGLALDPAVVDAFEAAAGPGRPRLAQLHLCWAESEREARRVAHRWWPLAALPPRLLPELADTEDFAALAQHVTEEEVARSVACGPDPDAHLAAIRRAVGAGYTTIYLHQVGPDQRGFFDFCARELMPRFREGTKAR